GWMVKRPLCKIVADTLLPAIRAWEGQYRAPMWLDTRIGKIHVCCEGGYRVLVWDIREHNSDSWRELFRTRILELIRLHPYALREKLEREFWNMGTVVNAS